MLPRLQEALSGRIKLQDRKTESPVPERSKERMETKSHFKRECLRTSQK